MKKEEFKLNCAMRIHMELTDSALGGSPLDKEEKGILRDFGGVEFGDTISRDVLVPLDIPLYALNYVIQTCFGFQNSHLHRFCLPDDVLSAIVENKTFNYFELVNVLFNNPWMSEESSFANDDYIKGSYKTWLRSKYTGPYESKCFEDSPADALYDIDSMKKRCEFVEVEKKTFKDGRIGYFYPRRISKEEYEVRKANPPTKKKDGIFPDDSSEEIVVMTLEELPLAAMGYIFESCSYDAVKERLAVKDVLALEEDFTKLPESFDEFMTPRRRGNIERCMFGKNKHPKVTPVTKVLYYNYDFGDDWYVKITASKICTDLIENKRSSEKKLLNAELKVVENHRPVLVASDGFSVMDDVGGIHGYIEFLEGIHTGSCDHYDYDDSKETLAWAEYQGWSGKKVSLALL